MSEASDVLRDIDQLRRDLSGYHGQLKAHNDLQRHCDNQRERISELEGLYAKAKADRDENAMDFCKEHDRAEFLARENAKLREELAKARDPQRIGGQADPSSFVYAIEQLREFRWQHATNDEDAIPYINNVAAAHERENAKLRELVTRMARALSVGGDWCVRECYAEFRCKGSCEIADALVELGIAEVVK